MPVTIRPAKDVATIPKWEDGVEGAEHLLRIIRGTLGVDTMIQSSFQNLRDRPPIHANDHDFVASAVRAYGDHLHLVMRPEDVWFANLTQLRFYTNKHAEELRGTFFVHQGTKNVVITTEATPQSSDSGEFATKMAKLIEQHLVDPELRAWIQPYFTTTTEEDVTVAFIILMVTSK